MKDICIYFQVHQPVRLKIFEPFAPKLKDKYFDMGLNKKIFDKVAGKCYWPTNRLMLELLDTHKELKLTYGITGTWIEQCREFQPELLETFRDMAKTGRVEFLVETYYHSLASLWEDKEEFKEQVKLHDKLIREEIGYKPKFFRNSELIYNNKIAKTVQEMGYKGIYTEGIEWVLDGWKSPNYVYKTPQHSGSLPVLLRNYRLSDDVGYRFSNRGFDQWPVTADKYANWLSSADGEIVNICMDYETFGEHQWEETGIFLFLRYLPQEILKKEDLRFETPSRLVEKHKPVGEVDVFEFSTISWADMERDASAWLGNDMQRCCFWEMQNLSKYVKKKGRKELLDLWRLMQTSDHYYYLCTKYWGDGDVHHYFSHMKDQQKAFLNFITIISDLKTKILADEETVEKKDMLSLLNISKEETDYQAIRKELDTAIDKVEASKKIPDETLESIEDKLDPKKHAGFIKLLRIWKK